MTNYLTFPYLTSSQPHHRFASPK